MLKKEQVEKLNLAAPETIDYLVRTLGSEGEYVHIWGSFGFLCEAALELYNKLAKAEAELQVLAECPCDGTGLIPCPDGEAICRNHFNVPWFRARALKAEAELKETHDLLVAADMQAEKAVVIMKEWERIAQEAEVEIAEMKESHALQIDAVIECKKELAKLKRLVEGKDE